MCTLPLAAGITGSNSAGSIDVSFDCCVLSLGRADHSCRGILPTEVCLSVVPIYQKRGDLDPLRLYSHAKKKCNCEHLLNPSKRSSCIVRALHLPVECIYW